MINDTKTGAIICRKSTFADGQLEYEALLFITDIPNAVTDEQLLPMLTARIESFTDNCTDVIIRADINSTANEVWEQYQGLNNDSGKALSIPYKDLMINF